MRTLPVPVIHIDVQPCLVEDVSAFVLIVVSAKLRGRTLVAEAPSLLDKVLQDATTYFLVLFTGHLIFVFFELFASVSDRALDL